MVAAPAPPRADDGERRAHNRRMIDTLEGVRVFVNTGSFSRSTSSQCFWISVAHALRARTGVSVTAASLKALAASSGARVNSDRHMVVTDAHDEAIKNLARILGLSIRLVVILCNADQGKLWVSRDLYIANKDEPRFITIVNYNKEHYEAVATVDEIEYFGEVLRAVPVLARSYVARHTSWPGAKCAP